MRHIKLDNFYIKSGLFTVLSLSGAFFNYVLYLVVARLFDVRQFGDFTTLLAIANQIIGILLAFNIVSIYLVKRFPEDEARAKAQIIQKILVWIFLGSTILVVIFSPFIRQRLHIADPTSFIIIGILLALAIPAIIWTGYLQGHKYLISVGIFTLASALAKLICCVALASIWGVRGGLIGVVIGAIVALIVLRLMSPVRLPHLSSVIQPFQANEWQFIKSQRTYVIGSIVVVGLLSVLQNIDITFAKALFSPIEAGMYSGVSIVSNALYYVAFLLIWILLPEISINNPTHNRHMLRTAYLLLGLLASGVIVIEVLGQNILIRAVLGPQFAGQSSLLVFASLFQLALVAATLYVYYLLVLRRRRALLLAGLVFVSATLSPLFGGIENLHNLIIGLFLSILCGWIIYSIINRIRDMVSHEETAEAR